MKPTTEQFTKIEFQAQHENWRKLHRLLRDEIKEITVDSCKIILKQFHSSCMDTTNKVCNLMLSLNVDSRGHKTGDMCEECPMRELCAVNDNPTHKIWCALAKLCLDIIQRKKITKEEVIQIQKYVDDSVALDTQGFGLLQSKIDAWGK